MKKPVWNSPIEDLIFKVIGMDAHTVEEVISRGWISQRNMTKEDNTTNQKGKRIRDFDI